MMAMAVRSRPYSVKSAAMLLYKSKTRSRSCCSGVSTDIFYTQQHKALC